MILGLIILDLTTLVLPGKGLWTHSFQGHLERHGKGWSGSCYIPEDSWTLGLSLFILHTVIFPLSISHQFQGNLYFFTPWWQAQFENLSLTFWGSVNSFCFIIF